MHRCRGAVEGSKRCSSTIKVESAAVATFGQLQPPHGHFRGARGGRGAETRGDLSLVHIGLLPIGAGRQPGQRVALCEGQLRHVHTTHPDETTGQNLSDSCGPAVVRSLGTCWRSLGSS